MILSHLLWNNSLPKKNYTGNKKWVCKQFNSTDKKNPASEYTGKQVEREKSRIQLESEYSRNQVEREKSRIQLESEYSRNWIERESYKTRNQLMT